VEPKLLSITRDDRPIGLLVLGSAGDGDVAPHLIVGEMNLLGGQPDYRSFRRNAAFIAFYTRYMRGELSMKPSILSQARVAPGAKVYVIDGRAGAGDVPWEDIIGWYDSHSDGSPNAATFVYNEEHQLVASSGKLSSLTSEDRLAKAAITSN
jgi:hypothetical protein